jgi:N utilization substance protein A
MVSFKIENMMLLITSNIQLYITRGSPAKVSSIKINEETKRAECF